MRDVKLILVVNGCNFLRRHPYPDKPIFHRFVACHLQNDFLWR